MTTAQKDRDTKMKKDRDKKYADVTIRQMPDLYVPRGIFRWYLFGVGCKFLMRNASIGQQAGSKIELNGNGTTVDHYKNHLAAPFIATTESSNRNRMNNNLKRKRPSSASPAVAANDGQEQNNEDDDNDNTTNTHHNIIMKKYLLPLLTINNKQSSSALLPSTLQQHVTMMSEKKKKIIGNDHNKLRQLLNDHGFRTSMVSSPRMAVSIYKDSCYCHCDDNKNDELTTTTTTTTTNNLFREGKEILLIALGLHPYQETIELLYNSTTTIKKKYCLRLFCQRLRDFYNDNHIIQNNKNNTDHDASSSNNSNGMDEFIKALEETENVCHIPTKQQSQRVRGIGWVSRRTSCNTNIFGDFSKRMF